MKSEDALESQTITRDIKDYNRNTWNESAEHLCYEGIKQKFDQNPSLKEILLSTENKTLVEASYDDVWGTGIPLSSEDCLIPAKWKTEGILGKILMHICDCSRESSSSSNTATDEVSMDASNAP